MKKIENKIEPIAGDVEPTFELNEKAQIAFDRIVEIMKSMGTLSPSYADIITLTASATGRMILAEEDLNERGHISYSERGEVKNQSFTVYSTANSLAQKGLSALGLTPSTLGKIKKADSPKDSPFAKFV